MGLLEFRHVDGDEVALAAIKQIGERQRRFRLADSAGAHQQENSDRFARVVQARLGRADTAADGLQRVRLPDHARAQVGL